VYEQDWLAVRSAADFVVQLDMLELSTLQRGRWYMVCGACANGERGSGQDHGWQQR
jgi:hypothetical protein